jgi:hypothetical protein
MAPLLMVESRYLLFNGFVEEHLVGSQHFVS